MKTADIRVQTDDQIEASLQGLKREQFNLRFQQATGQLEKSARVREVRRDIARLMTIQNERKAAEKGQENA